MHLVSLKTLNIQGNIHQEMWWSTCWSCLEQLHSSQMNQHVYPISCHLLFTISLNMSHLAQTLFQNSLKYTLLQLTVRERLLDSMLKLALEPRFFQARKIMILSINKMVNLNWQDNLLNWIVNLISVNNFNIPINPLLNQLIRYIQFKSTIVPHNW